MRGIHFSDGACSGCFDPLSVDSADPETGRRTELVPTHTPELFAAAVARAIELLRAGEVVALPTETVYGLAADARNRAAVRRIFEVKNRPLENPVIVHVVGEEMARSCAAQWSPEASQLAAAFWPGPLTLVLPKSSWIPEEVTAGGRTVGIRWPSHPLMQRIIREAGFPLAAPSANRANEISPTTAQHVYASLSGRIPMVVDGGASHVGIESTVVDLSVRPPRVLRPGIIHEESLSAVAGEIRLGPEDSGILRSPGQLERHYAPKARLKVVAWEDERELRRQLIQWGADPAGVHVLAYQRVPSAEEYGRVCVIPHDPLAYARAMYSEWHRCDELGARWIVVEKVPETAEWRGIADRLQRASAQSVEG